MSCSNIGNNNFAYLGDYTQDTLRFQDWDPYPELKGPFSDYKSCAKGACNGGDVKENYGKCCGRDAYINLSDCWEVKPKYSS